MLVAGRCYVLYVFYLFAARRLYWLAGWFVVGCVLFGLFHLGAYFSVWLLCFLYALRVGCLGYCLVFALGLCLVLCCLWIDWLSCLYGWFSLSVCWWFVWLG